MEREKVLSVVKAKTESKIMMQVKMRSVEIAE